MQSNFILELSWISFYERVYYCQDRTSKIFFLVPGSLKIYQFFLKTYRNLCDQVDPIAKNRLESGLTTSMYKYF